MAAVLAASKPGKPAPKPPAAPTVEMDPSWRDLLDFDRGSLMLSAPPSRGQGVEAWAPLWLVDGSPAGWCSAEDAKGRLEFVFELERDSTVHALRISTEGAEETTNPGISARRVELWGAAATGAFEPLGSFELPRLSRSEFALPAHAPVRRLKLVVTANWGHPLFTELMELDVLGLEVGPAPKLDLKRSEYYSKQWGGLVLKQSGNRLEGCYDYNGGSFFGELEGRVARVVFTELVINGKPRIKGIATFIVSSDRSTMRGVYYVDGDLAVRGEWDLRRVERAEEKPKCDLSTFSLREQLKRTGRIRLYGIQFDVNADSPQADSEPTLTSILEMMQEEPTFKVLVEGHTDSTNSQRYNQQLSERRAAAVRKWLIDRGVKPGRLQAKGFGFSRQVAGNDTAQGRALNRRVELSLLP